MHGPWQKPARDPHADRVEALLSGGMGGTRPPPNKASIGMVLALTAGILLPAVAMFTLYGLAFAAVAAVVVAAIGVLAWRKAAAARARARARAEARAQRTS
jgi:hypothetical protein